MVYNKKSSKENTLDKGDGNQILYGKDKKMKNYAQKFGMKKNSKTAKKNKKY
jgi:hypothetical protein